MYCVFMTTISEEISKFCLLLKSLSAARSHSLACACITAIELVRRGWSKTVRLLNEDGQRANECLDTFEARVMIGVSSVIKEVRSERAGLLDAGCLAPF